MKKGIIFLLTLFMIAAPVFATVTITVDPGPGPNDVTVGFTSDEEQMVRMISLDVQVDDPGVVIVDINCVSDGYNIHPGSISIDNDGNVVDWGTCAGTDLDSNALASEQGSLYVGAANEPAPGALFIITLGGCMQTEGGDVVVAVSPNVLRGGVVMEDASAPTAVDTSDTATVSMLAGSYCGPACASCMGDVVGNTGPDPDGIVNTADLGALMGLLGPLGPPFDYGSVPEGYACLDIAGSTSPVPDGVLNTADLGAMMAFLGPFGPPFDSGQCMPAPPSGP
jgi:hypothetical protein